MASNNNLNGTTLESRNSRKQETFFDYDYEQRNGRLSQESASSNDSPRPGNGTRHYKKDTSIATTNLSSEETLTSDHGGSSRITEPLSKDKLGSVKWMELPRKDQLFILLLTRLAEPLTQTSLQAYMFYMLKSFDENASDSTIASQAGWLAGSFTAAQCITAVFWGRLADKEWCGRKNVLLVGLLGTLISTVGFGFSRSLWMAMLFRSFGGALNGNVGVMRTMISEIIKEKRYQPKAFLILPMTFNVGVLVGPLLGGWLQDPAHTYPGVFGPGSRLGGKDGVWWMLHFPYALPNLLSAVFLLLSAALVVLGLEETHIDRRYRADPCLSIGRWIGRFVSRPFRKRPSTEDYLKISTSDEDQDMELQPSSSSISKPFHKTNTSLDNTPNPYSHRPRPKLPVSRIFTRNVLSTFAAHALMHIHIASFSTLWFLFLSTPRYNLTLNPPSLPFTFTGGLGMPPSTIGFAIGILGILGLVLQFGVYSRVVARLGILRTYHLATLIFPFVYILVAYLAVIPTHSAPPHEADGPALWIAITILLFAQVVGRTFVLPITQILVNNCSPHPSVLGTVHGIGQSVSSGSRTVGPVVWSALYGWGLRRGVVGAAWWILGVEAVLAAVAGRFLYEGSGHEISLEGDDAEDD